MTGPRTGPGVDGDQPADSRMSRWSLGATMRPRADCRLQPRAIFQPSRLTFARPYFWNLLCVHWLALFNLGEPVSRGPIMSQTYSRLSINCEFLSISPRM